MVPRGYQVGDKQTKNEEKDCEKRERVRSEKKKVKEMRVSCQEKLYL